MERSVPLDLSLEQLPVPPELVDRFHYDATRHRLAFRGRMSKAVFDQLSTLNPSWPYRRALEDLFRECTDDDEPDRGRWRLGRFFGRS